MMYREEGVALRTPCALWLFFYEITILFNPPPLQGI